MTDGRSGDAESLANGVDLTSDVPLRAPGAGGLAGGAMRGLMRGALFLGLGVLVILSISVGGFLSVLARGPIAFDWLAPTIVQSLDELYAHRYTFGLSGVALANTDRGPTSWPRD